MVYCQSEFLNLRSTLLENFLPQFIELRHQHLQILRNVHRQFWQFFKNFKWIFTKCGIFSEQTAASF